MCCGISRRGVGWAAVGRSVFFLLFGAGKMPEPIRSGVTAEQPVVFAEGYRGWLRRNGTLPGGIIVGGIRSQMGSFAITPSRVVVTASKHVVVDLPFQDSVESANTTVTISSEGLRLNTDVAAAVRGGTGKMELKFNRALSPDELARVPARQLAFSMEENVAGPLFTAYLWGGWHNRS
jgi:hypothetical protein